ncbi:hypothetical protein SNE40_005662 [Patella caerulea]|uniref:Uncharacterized protein n=1 Tax=Patella caerulea TaxID=87958 RepID=A0AAN8PWS2_PATCE
MKLVQSVAWWLTFVTGLCSARDATLASIQRHLKNLQTFSTNSEHLSSLSRSPSLPIEERSITDIEPVENSRQTFIKNILSQRHTHRPIVKTFDPIAEEDRLQEYLAERLRRKHEHRPLKHKRACRGVEKGLKTLRCPSDDSICLHDDMICNSYRDCPNGEDENPAVCLIHDWASRWFSKIQYYLIPNKST